MAYKCLSYFSKPKRTFNTLVCSGVLTAGICLTNGRVSENVFESKTEELDRTMGMMESFAGGILGALIVSCKRKKKDDSNDMEEAIKELEETNPTIH